MFDARRQSIWTVTQDAAAYGKVPDQSSSSGKGGGRRRSSLANASILSNGTSISSKHVNDLPEKLLLHIFSYIRQKEIPNLARVCKKWRLLGYNGQLWTRISLRPEYSNLYVSNHEMFLHLIANRFAQNLRYMELPCELITPPVMHELAARCPNLRHLTLDFASAMQLHDFNDLNAFPCNLRSLTICLSEVIFMEGFMRKVYQSLATLEVLHLIGTFELGDEEQEEIYEVINISKIKTHTPNLRIVNLYGIGFVDDSHVELLSSNCIHLECLALNFCLRVTGSTFKVLIYRCKKLRTLLLQHCGLVDEHMMAVEWEQSRIHELDLTSTELSQACLMDILVRMPGFVWLGLGYCEFFDDKILEELTKKGKLDHLRALDVSHTVSLSEGAIYNFIKLHGRHLLGLMIAGKPKLLEQFFLNIIPLMKKIKILVCGTPNGWFLKMTSKVHVDQIMISLSHNATKLERLELQWDPDTIRSSDNSSKFIDLLRLRCPQLRSLTLSDGEYYEMVKSNFERADRVTVVRTCTNYRTSCVSLLHYYKDLLFN